MTANILSEFKQILKEVGWMDQVSRQAALDKAEAITPQIAYADIIFNNSYLERLYNVVHFFGDFKSSNNLIVL